MNGKWQKTENIVKYFPGICEMYNKFYFYSIMHHFIVSLTHTQHTYAYSKSKKSNTFI